jgi:predicted amidophosphoribosyltransferase
LTSRHRSVCSDCGTRYYDDACPRCERATQTRLGEYDAPALRNPWEDVESIENARVRRGEGGDGE